MTRAIAALILALGLLALPEAQAHEGHAKAKAAEEPGEPGERLYDPPAPGTYELPPIRRVSEHDLIGADGKRGPILGLAPGRAAVVSFIYTSCSDAGGCPLSLAVLQRLDAALAAKPDLGRRVRLVTVSFDPARDTPVRMNDLRGTLAPRGDWRFFTARDDATLAPVLADFDQDAARVLTETGKETSRIQHVLKVFLVDGRGDVRNIYSTGFLDERLLVNDLETVLR